MCVVWAPPYDTQHHSQYLLPETRLSSTIGQFLRQLSTVVGWPLLNRILKTATPATLYLLIPPYSYNVAPILKRCVMISYLGSLFSSRTNSLPSLKVNPTSSPHKATLSYNNNKTLPHIGISVQDSVQNIKTPISCNIQPSISATP